MKNTVYVLVLLSCTPYLLYAFKAELPKELGVNVNVNPTKPLDINLTPTTSLDIKVDATLEDLKHAVENFGFNEENRKVFTASVDKLTDSLEHVTDAAKNLGIGKDTLATLSSTTKDVTTSINNATKSLDNVSNCLQNLGCNEKTLSTLESLGKDFSSSCQSLNTAITDVNKTLKEVTSKPLVVETKHTFLTAETTRNGIVASGCIMGFTTGFSLIKQQPADPKQQCVGAGSIAFALVLLIGNAIYSRQPQKNTQPEEKATSDPKPDQKSTKKPLGALKPKALPVK